MRNRIISEAPDVQFDPNDDMDTRLRKLAPLLDWGEREYGLNAEMMAGMAINESGLGTAPTGYAGKANNLWSMTYLPSDSQSTGPIPQGRWAAYPSIKAAYARFAGMYAHPENGHAVVWTNRKDPDKLTQAFVDDHYIVEEPGHPVSGWRQGIQSGRQRYRQAIGRP
jgi:hypothetical protein